MHLTKSDVLRRIERRFKKQGGTGYHGCMEYNGCRCALAAAARVDYEEKAFKVMRGMGFRDGDVGDLEDAHDGALKEARDQHMEGIELSGTVARARLGTPAYEHVWGKLKEWAEGESSSCVR